MKSNSSGFTLIEMILSLTLACVLLGLLSVSSSAMDSDARTREQVTKVIDTLRAARKLARDQGLCVAVSVKGSKIDVDGYAVEDCTTILTGSKAASLDSPDFSSEVSLTELPKNLDPLVFDRRGSPVLDEPLSLQMSVDGRSYNVTVFPVTGLIRYGLPETLEGGGL